MSLCVFVSVCIPKSSNSLMRHFDDTHVFLQLTFLWKKMCVSVCVPQCVYVRICVCVCMCVCVKICIYAYCAQTKVSAHAPMNTSTSLEKTSRQIHDTKECCTRSHTCISSVVIHKSFDTSIQTQTVTVHSCCLRYFCSCVTFSCCCIVAAAP